MTPEEQKQTIINCTIVALTRFGYHYAASWIEDYLTLEECDAVLALFRMDDTGERVRRGTTSEQAAIDDLMSGVWDRNPGMRIHQRLQDLGRGQ